MVSCGRGGGGLRAGAGAGRGRGSAGIGGTGGGRGLEDETIGKGRDVLRNVPVAALLLRSSGLS
jgi:hypothetical protein